MQFKYIVNILIGITLVNARVIMLLRHGEKLDDTTVYLSDQGKARAECLAEKFGKVFFPPEKIYAQSPDDKKPSTRPRDTALSLSKKFGLDINLTYNKGQAEDLVKDIKKTPEEVVLVSWSNDELNNIGRELGVINSPSWDGKVFDQLWIISKIGEPFVLPGADVKPIAVYYGKEYCLRVVMQDVDDCILEYLKKWNGNNAQLSPSDDKTTRIIKIIKTSQPSSDTESVTYEGHPLDKENMYEDENSTYKINTNIIIAFSIIFTILVFFI